MKDTYVEFEYQLQRDEEEPITVTVEANGSYHPGYDESHGAWVNEWSIKKDGQFWTGELTRQEKDHIIDLIAGRLRQEYARDESKTFTDD